MGDSSLTGISGEPANEFLKKMGREHPVARGLLLWMMGRSYPVFVDYPVDPVPRYGYGKPPHPGLYRLIDANREIYREYLGRFLEFEEQLARIPAHSNDSEPISPSWINMWMPPLDSLALYSILSIENPANYMEVGSGYSTMVCRRAIEDHGLRTRITSVDPQPRAEIDSICDEVIRSRVEEVDPGVFGVLGEGDVLFVDNTHRVFMNSDATAVSLDIMPTLQPGVLVHFHDIFLPFDYPPEISHRYYSEQYLLAAYLLGGGGAVETVLPSAFISSDPELSGILAPLNRNPALAGVRFSGWSFWIKSPAGPGGV